MFGSKLRSWMENHIVRPRKKGSKNKSANSTVATTSATGNSLDGYKNPDARGFTIYHGNGTTTTATSITAAVAVSCGAATNQNGCSSAISSPVRRREVSPIQNHTQSRYGWQSPDQEAIMSPKSDNFLYAPQHHRVRASTPTNSKDTLSEQKCASQQQVNCSSSSFSSLSWSTGSKEPSTQSVSQKYAKTMPCADVVMQNHSPPHTEYQDVDEDPNTVHYEEIRTLIRQPDMSVHNENFLQQRPKSEQCSLSYSPVRSCDTDNATNRYGRLLPSKMSSQLIDPKDTINANHLRSTSAECIPSNNNYGGSGTFKIRSHATGQITHSAGIMPTRNKLRTVRYAGNGSIGPVAGVSAATGVPINSLSSPESAYSTGYSTDGTSPGAIYTPPEYYINMRTGTHYFPKSVNSLAIEAQRYKFGLNKIEEMSPQDPLPNTATIYRRTEAHDKIPGFGIPDPEFCRSQMKLLEPQRPLQSRQTTAVGCHSPLSLRNTIVLPTLKGFESPSPRQRCRIRTNPWYSTTDTSSSGATTLGNATTQPFEISANTRSTISSTKSSASSAKKMELDAGSTSSSGVKSTSEADAETSTGKNLHNGKPSYDSESSSSLTEVENMQRTYTPNTMRRKRAELPVAEMSQYHSPTQVGVVVERVEGCVLYQDLTVSDDDATLNEMMGKFDESYVYEKETDILSSDSDPTDCPSDLDTGQDAGDECDTDELLDIDFIDTASIQEVCDRKDSQRNLGSCYYYSQSQSPAHHPKQQQQCERRSSVRSRRNSRVQRGLSQEGTDIAQSAGMGGSQRRRKRFQKTRKKSAESRGCSSPLRGARESRSVGGTPVCLRRNQSAVKDRVQKSSPLTNRSSSLVFTDVHHANQRFVTIAESEKALLEADLEADVKYRQLIFEAESILVSMKNSATSLPRDTPVASPRRVNPLGNKRVEMLKHCEGEVKREILKQQQQKALDVVAEQEFVAGVNKRIELLKCETASAPNSPRFSRFSPRKTHLTNFINQIAPPEVPPRKSSFTDIAPPQSPQLQLNGRQLQSPRASPLPRRRVRSQSPRPAFSYCDSDSDAELQALQTSRTSLQRHESYSRESRESMRKASNDNVANRNYLPEIARIMLYDESDYKNRNVATPAAYGGGAATLLPYNAVSMMSNYCPQSEPLKRKVYKGSSSFERIKQSFDLESGKSGTNSCCFEDDDDEKLPLQYKLQKAIVDLKRSLQNQSVELNGLNEVELLPHTHLETHPNNTYTHHA